MPLESHREECPGQKGEEMQSFFFFFLFFHSEVGRIIGTAGKITRASLRLPGGSHVVVYN